MDLRLAPSSSLTPFEVERIRKLCELAFSGEPRLGSFTDEDLEHALGGLHAILVEGSEILAHGSLVERELHVGGRPVREGYLEAVAVLPGLQGRGLGTRVVRALSEEVRARFQLGALDTGSFGFYERLGWERWRGPTFVREPEGERRTPEEDGYVMILRTSSSPADLDLDTPISCDPRPGDVW